MLAMSYFIDLLTVASLSAIATNGKVRGGGQYYLLSRSLGTMLTELLCLSLTDLVFAKVLNSAVPLASPSIWQCVSLPL